MQTRPHRVLGAVFFSMTAVPYIGLLFGIPAGVDPWLMNAAVGLSVVGWAVAIWLWAGMPIVALVAWALPIGLVVAISASLPLDTWLIVNAPMVVLLAVLVFYPPAIDAWCIFVGRVEARVRFSLRHR